MSYTNYWRTHGTVNCGWCGLAVRDRYGGRHRAYCGNTCKNRAWRAAVRAKRACRQSSLNSDLHEDSTSKRSPA